MSCGLCCPATLVSFSTKQVENNPSSHTAIFQPLPCFFSCLAPSVNLLGMEMFFSDGIRGQWPPCVMGIVCLSGERIEAFLCFAFNINWPNGVSDLIYLGSLMNTSSFFSLKKNGWES